MDDSEIAFDERGLVPCIVQDWRTGEVLTLAYMNAESLRLTRETGEVHFFSRSRQELWHKGATSGNTLSVKSIRYDCDADALLALVEPAGPACHTGERSCFHRGDLNPGRRTRRCRCSSERSPSGRRPGRRAPTRRSCSTTRGRGAKVQEEAEEVVRAAREESDERVAEEAADVIYHLAVLLRGRGLSLPTPSGSSMAVASGADTTPAGFTPSLTETRALAADYNLIPVRETFIDDCQTPVSAFLKLRGAEPSFLLESADQGRVGRYSFIGFRPRKVLRWSLGDRGDPYALAAAELGPVRAAPLPDLPPFAGGAVGLFAYDLVRTVEPLGEPNPDPIGVPDLALMLTDALVVFDHLKHTVTVIANVYADEDLEASYARALETIAEVRWRLAGPVPRPPRPPARDRTVAPLQPNMTREQFEANVARIIEYIYAGDAFQVVPSQRWSGRSRSRRSRSTAGCARSTPARTCTSWTSATSRSPARAPSR